jgi:hypothetical protein
VVCALLERLSCRQSLLQSYISTSLFLEQLASIKIFPFARGGGGDSPGSDPMAFVLSLIPQNYSKSQDKALCTLCKVCCIPA